MATIASKDELGTLIPQQDENELINDRTANCKKFVKVRADGRKEFRISACQFPIHFRRDVFSDTEPYKDIDIDIIPTPNEDWNYGLENNGYQVHIWESMIVAGKRVNYISQFRRADKWVTIAPLGLVWENDAGDSETISETITDIVPEIDNETNSITWKNCFGQGLDYCINVHPERFFKTVIVNNKSDLPNPTISNVGLKLSIVLGMSWHQDSRVSNGFANSIRPTILPNDLDRMPSDEHQINPEEFGFEDEQLRNTWWIRKPIGWDSTEEINIFDIDWHLRRKSNKVYAVLSMLYKDIDDNNVTYPVLLDIAITQERIANSHDDCNSYSTDGGGGDFDDGSEGFNYYYSPGYLRFGYTGSTYYQTGLHFQTIPFPENCLITWARIAVMAGYLADSGDWKMIVCAEKSALSDFWTTDHRPGTGGTPGREDETDEKFHWDFTTFNELVWYSIQDLKDVTQEVVSLPDWEISKNISFIIRGDTDCTDYQYIFSRNFLATNRSARYDATYEEVQNNDFTFSYNAYPIPAEENLLITDQNTDKIYINSGLTSTTIASFSSPHYLPTGITYDGSNIISADRSAAKIYTHYGLSDYITDSFIKYNVTGLATIEDDLISCSIYPSKIYQHSGFTSTIAQSFSSPEDDICEIAWDGSTLISADATEDKIYIHYGFSATVVDSFTAHQAHGLTFDEYGNIVAGQAGQTHITIYVGKTSTVSSTFSSPGDYTSGLEYVSAIRSASLPFSYNMFPIEVLVTTDNDSNKVYIHSGVTAVITNSFVSSGGVLYGITIDTDNIRIITLEQVSDKFYVHDGFTSNVTDSFYSPGTSPTGVAYLDYNIISCDYNSDRIYVHDGVSSTVTTSFSTPGSLPSSLGTDGTHLLSADEGNNTIYVHSGVTATITDSFLAPHSGVPYGVDVDSSGNLLSLVFIGLPANGTISIHDGISSTVKSSFDSPYTGPSGMGYYSDFFSTDLAFSYDILPIPESQDLTFSYNLGPAGDIIHSDPVNDLIYVHNRLTGDITRTFSAPATNITGITISYPEEPIQDLTFSYDIGDYVVEEVDVEVFITPLVPSTTIEIYVPGVAKYSCDEDENVISRVNLQLNEDHGISRIGNMTLTLSNIDGRYSDSSASSIFIFKQVVKDPIRIKSGWGPNFNTDVETQFQGLIKRIEENDDRTARFTAYDTLKRLIDYSFETDETVSTTEVPNMNPASIVEYLVKDIAGIQIFDMDLLSNVDLMDATSLAAAELATGHFSIGTTTIPEETRMITVLQDLMKIINGYLYCGKDGRLYILIYDALSIPATLKAFEGDETASVKHIIGMRKYKDEDSIINRINWTYNTASGTDSKLIESDVSSIQDYGEKPIDLSTLWNADPIDLIATSGITFARYSKPINKYDSMISWLPDGEAMKVDLGEVIEISDPSIHETSKQIFVTGMKSNIQKQYTEFEAEEANALIGKFFIFCSEVDEGDGKGITGSSMANYWDQRYWYLCNAPLGDPHYDGSNPGFDPSGNNNGVLDPSYGTPDEWGNGIEECFIFY